MLTIAIIVMSFPERRSFDVGAARAGLVVAHHTDRLDIVDLWSIQAPAADIHVCLAVELRAFESRGQPSVSRR